MGAVDFNLRSDLHEGFVSLFRTKRRERFNQEQLTSYFAAFFGLPQNGSFENTAGSDIVVFSFTITSINNETGADSFFDNDLGAAIGLFLFVFDAQSVSVSVKGQLTRVSTGTVLAEDRVTESVNLRRSFLGRKVPSLPMIEVAAVRLLKSLRQEACL